MLYIRYLEIEKMCNLYGFGRSGKNIGQFGRSMIEMLGVLAIIGVLSVGGIAGYSKAMEKFRHNRMIDEYKTLIMGLIEYRESIMNSIAGVSGDNSLYQIIMAADLIPPTWEKVGISFTDTYGNLIYTYATNYSQTKYEPHINMHIRLGGNQGEKQIGFDDNTCADLYSNLILPLVDTFQSARLERGHHFSESKTYYGNGKCGENRECISKLTPVDIYNICKSCDKENEPCSIILSF